ncbi:hypothetical protein ACVW07_002497 [Cellulomonas sp. URHB0016]
MNSTDPTPVVAASVTSYPAVVDCTSKEEA